MSHPLRSSRLVPLVATLLLACGSADAEGGDGLPMGDAPAARSGEEEVVGRAALPDDLPPGPGSGSDDVDGGVRAADGYCATLASPSDLCLDFDQKEIPATYAGNAVQFGSTNGGMHRMLGAADARSLPRAHELAIPATSGAASTIDHFFSAKKPTRVKLGFSVRAVTPAALAAGRRIALVQLFPSGTKRLVLEMVEGGALRVSLAVTSLASTLPTKGALATGTWSRVDLELDTTAATPTAPGKLRVVQDGTTIFDRDVSGEVVSAMSDPRVSFGPRSTVSQAATFVFDDLVAHAW